MSIDAVIALERLLFDPPVRRSAERLDELLADNFREIGASGTMWTRQDMIDALVKSDDSPIVATNFVGQFVDTSTILLTYDTALARRSSLWKQTDGRWRLVFH